MQEQDRRYFTSNFMNIDIKLIKRICENHVEEEIKSNCSKEQKIGNQSPKLKQKKVSKFPSFSFMLS